MSNSLVGAYKLVCERRWRWVGGRPFGRHLSLSAAAGSEGKISGGSSFLHPRLQTPSPSPTEPTETRANVMFSVTATFNLPTNHLPSVPKALRTLGSGAPRSLSFFLSLFTVQSAPDARWPKQRWPDERPLSPAALALESPLPRGDVDRLPSFRAPAKLAADARPAFLRTPEPPT